MSKRYYFISTNAYECVASVGDETVRVLVENNQEAFPHDDEDGNTSPKAALQFLCRIEDDSSWEVMEGAKALKDVLNSDDEIVSSIDESETFVYRFEIVKYSKEFTSSKKKAIRTGCTYSGSGDSFPRTIQSFSGCRLNLSQAMKEAAEAFKNYKSSVEKATGYFGTYYYVTEYVLSFNVYTADGDWVDANAAGYYKCGNVLLTSSDHIKYTELNLLKSDFEIECWIELENNLSGFGKCYHAIAEDVLGNQYDVYWQILEGYNPDSQSEKEACDWKHPCLVLDKDRNCVTDNLNNFDFDFWCAKMWR